MKNKTSNCWLEFPRISSCSGKKLLISNEFEGVVAERTGKEAARAIEKLYNMETVTEGDADYTLQFKTDSALPKEAYHIECQGKVCVISASDANGALYGLYAWLRELQMQQCLLKELTYSKTEVPSNPLRMFNHWDNMDGSIERGYSGNSFFFKNNKIINGKRIKAYARMCASIGINGIVINNVNVKGAAIGLISEHYYEPLRKMQEVFASFGIKMYLCIEFAAPIFLGGMETADPCDREVIKWWRDKSAEVYENLPGLGGYMIKADSEGRPGPFTYGRNHADGANMLADSISMYGGIVIWRCFVYNCRQDWRDTSIDRARAAYDHYEPLDGKFRDNVILQIKNGPIDFQVREPVSPLFGGLHHTNMMLEVQVAQEYTGQQKHVCYLIPWFKEVLAQDMYCCEGPSTVADLVSTRSYGNKLGGMAAVANTGDDPNWTGHDLAAANLYGFGRLAFNTNLTGEEIISEWSTQTYGKSDRIEAVMTDILMKSWPAYEKYSAPLGIGFMCHSSNHFGPSVDAYEYSPWGTYHHADWRGIGNDRTYNGTGYVAQYAKPLADMYNNLETCPDELVLFFHHLPYTYVLHSGKTVLQHIYDTHFEGAEMAAGFVEEMKSIQDIMPEEAYERIMERLEFQKVHACEWRDVINTYFYRKTGLEDGRGRKIYN